MLLARPKRLSPDASESELLNLAVAIYLAPYSPVSELDRLLNRARGLERDRGSQLLEVAVEACRVGFDFIWDRGEGAGENFRAVAREEADRVVLELHPWVDKTNLKHIYNKGCFYGWHG